MKNQFNRRKFVFAATAGCSILLSGKLSAFTFAREEIPNPKELNYCGYKCPEDCELLEATIKNDPELKKAAYETWEIKERHNVDFIAEKIFCYGCKVEEKPLGVVVTGCTVRQCAIDKQMDACIECRELKSCEKDLWQRFPDFHKTVVKMQESYFEAKN